MDLVFLLVFLKLLSHSWDSALGPPLYIVGQRVLEFIITINANIVSNFTYAILDHIPDRV